MPPDRDTGAETHPDPDPGADGPDAGAERPGPQPMVRRSVAARRESKGTRSTLIIGGIAILGIIASMVMGFVMNKRASVVPEDGYGPSRSAAVTVGPGGAIDLGPVDAPLHLTIYQDATCDVCGEFESQFGQQIAKAVDEGRLRVSYLMVDFYNLASVSQDYSTRAYAALLASAEADPQAPGSFARFFTAVFDPDTKPGEGDDEDLDDEQLARLARDAGVPDAACDRIAAGTGVAAAAGFAAAHIDSLETAWGEKAAGMDTPTVLVDGAMVSTNDPQWLTVLLGDDAAG